MTQRPTHPGPLPGGVLHLQSSSSAEGTKEVFMYRGHKLVWEGTKSTDTIWCMRVFVDEQSEPLGTAFFDLSKPSPATSSTLEDLCVRVYAAVELMDAPHLATLAAT